MGQNTSAKKNSPDPVTKAGKVVLKLVLMGDTFVGRTHLMERLVNDKYDFNAGTTVAVSVVKTIRLSQDKIVDVQIWDTPGMYLERPALLPMNVRIAEGVLLMCDVTNQRTLDNVPVWKEKLDSIRKTANLPSVPCLLLANKIDLAEHREVQPESLHEVSTRLGCVGWREVSVKDGTGVKEASQFLVRLMLRERGVHTDEAWDLG